MSDHPWQLSGKSVLLNSAASGIGAVVARRLTPTAATIALEAAPRLAAAPWLPAHDKGGVREEAQPDAS